MATDEKYYTLEPKLPESETDEIIELDMGETISNKIRFVRENIKKYDRKSALFKKILKGGELFVLILLFGTSIIAFLQLSGIITGMLALVSSFMVGAYTQMGWRKNAPKMKKAAAKSRQIERRLIRLATLYKKDSTKIDEINVEYEKICSEISNLEVGTYGYDDKDEIFDY